MAQKRRNTRGASRQNASSPAGSAPQWFGAGLASGLFLAFLVYLVTLPPEPGDEAAGPPAVASVENKQGLTFEFWNVLPTQEITVDVDPAEVPPPRDSGAASGKQYLLQAGSFRDREDADRRRAELLLLALDPRVEETRGDNGRWFRVVLGPFESRSSMNNARSLTAQQGFDTLLMQRSVN